MVWPPQMWVFGCLHKIHTFQHRLRRAKEVQHLTEGLFAIDG